MSAELAYLEFRSEVVTAKGEAYGNRYVARAQARQGELTRWLEFFDPRPAELIRRDFAASARSRAAAPGPPQPGGSAAS